MKFPAAVVLVAALAWAAPAKAQIVDLSTMPCKEFTSATEEVIKLIMMWMAGYYADQDDPPVIDFNKLAQKSAKLGEFCRQNPTIGLITAAEPIMEAK